MIAQFPYEVTARIIRECLPAWKGGWANVYEERCEILENLRKVSWNWEAIVKKEEMRCMTVDLIGELGELGIDGALALALLRQSSSDEDMEGQLNGALLVRKLQISVRTSMEIYQGLMNPLWKPRVATIKEIFSSCANLEEIGIPDLNIETLKPLLLMKGESV